MLFSKFFIISRLLGHNSNVFKTIFQSSSQQKCNACDYNDSLSPYCQEITDRTMDKNKEANSEKTVGRRI